MLKAKIVIPVILMIFCYYCKKVPFYADEGAVLIISADKTYLNPGGESAVITVLGFTGEGDALHDHTMVLFSATLGTLSSSEVELMQGRAIVEFISGSISGVAQINARSGNITAEPAPLEITIGSAALDNLSISANPSSFGFGGGRTRIRVFAFDAVGNLLPSVPIILTATAGYFEKDEGIYITDNSGIVEDYLNITETATVSAKSGITDGENGNKSASVEIPVAAEEENELPNANFTFSPASPVRGEKVYFNGSLSTDNDGYIVKWEWDFGDGKTGTGEKIDHSYTWAGTGSRTFNVVLKVIDDGGGEKATEKAVTVSPVPVVF
jgi:PKD repeat protein